MVVDRRRTKTATVAVTATVLVGIGCASGALAKTEDDPLLPSEVVARLSAPRTAMDSLPDSLDLAALGVPGLTETARYMGTSERGQHWIGTQGTSEICLISQLDDGTSGSVCASPPAVEQRGLTLGLSGDESARDAPAEVAILLPDSVDATPSSTWRPVGELVVANQAQIRPGTTHSFARRSGNAPAIRVRG